VSDWLILTQMNNFSAISWWEQATFWWWRPLCTRSTCWVGIL